MKEHNIIHFDRGSINSSLSPPPLWCKSKT